MGAKRLGYGGAKRLGLKIEAKRLGGKRLGGKRLGGETSCYRFTDRKLNCQKISTRFLLTKIDIFNALSQKELNLFQLGVFLSKFTECPDF